LRQKFGNSREILIGRELTKKFEEVARLPLAEAPEAYRLFDNREATKIVMTP